MQTWRPGDHLVMRDVRNGVVRAATPVRVIASSPARLVYCTAPGTRFFMRSSGRRSLGYNPDTAPFEAHTWEGHGSLTIVDADEPG